MKKIFIIALSVFIFFVNACVGWAAYYDEGNDGNSWETAYIIKTSADLQLMSERVAMREDIGKYYKLDSDIDEILDEDSYWFSIGVGNTYGDIFRGHFDGQNHTINIGSHSGLFGTVSAYEDTIAIRNLKVIGNVGSKGYNYKYVGDQGISIAETLASGIIENCSFTGSISSDTPIGGIVKNMNSGVIRNCSVDATISATYLAGGIVATMEGGTIEKCTVEGQITATTVGGIIGREITNSVDSITLTDNSYPSQYQEFGSVAHVGTQDLTQKGASYHEYQYFELNSGDTWEDAYVIRDEVDFMLMLANAKSAGAEAVGKYFKLSADINMASETLSNSFGYFLYAHLDGQNHAITLNGEPLFVTINVSQDEIAVRNLNLTGTTITASLAENLQSGIIENCSFNGTVKLEANIILGGLISLLSDGIIRNCRVNCTIENTVPSASSEQISASDGENTRTMAGGIVGYMLKGTITNCTVEAGSIINAGSYAGGIAGYVNEGTITNCTSNATLSANYVGGIAGGISSDTAVNFSGNSSGNYSEYGFSAVYTDTGGNTTTETITTITWNKHRYQIYNENVTWEQAESRCEELGGHLVTITSTEEQERVQYLLEHAQTDYSSYWIGASANDSGFWEWITDEVFEKQYQNFAQSQLDSAGIYLEIAVNGEWYKARNVSHGFICEFEEAQDKIEKAPVANDFESWQKNPDAWIKTEDDGVPSGALPSPIDTSHLASNPPKGDTDSNAIPSSFDVRSKITLPNVKNQGSYLTCWAFASIGAMEIDYLLHNMKSLGENPDLSELHVAWFSYPAANRKIQGGNPDTAEAFLKASDIAPINEKDMPYSEILKVDKEKANDTVKTLLNGKDAGSFDKAKITLRDTQNFELPGNYDTDVNKNMDIIKKAIMEHGSVYFRYISVTGDYNRNKEWQFYSTNESGLPHAALLVGWDDQYPAENFLTKPSKNGAWLIRTTINNANPIGDEYGCFWMSYEQAASQSGLAELRAFIVAEDEVESLQQEGNTGENTNITYSWSANIFNAQRNESLIRVGFNTTDNNVHYQIFVNNFSKIKPTDPGKTENCVISGDISTAGYHTIDLSTPIKLYKGDYYSIILELTPSSFSTYKYNTAVAANIENYATIAVNEGENFFAAGSPVPSVWQDGQDIEGGPFNACIQAFTIARITDETAPSITTESLPDANIGEDYEFKLEASGTATIEWRAKLPEGFALSREGLLTGKSETTGSYEIKFTAFNDVGMTDKTFTLKVSNSDLFSSHNSGCNTGLSVLCCVFALVFINMKRR